jgi:hypothetical protein
MSRLSVSWNKISSLQNLPTLAFAPVKWAVAGGGRISPTRVARRGHRRGSICPSYAPPNALGRQARDGELKFKSRHEAWPVARCRVPDGQATSLRGAETFVGPSRCRKA